MESKSAKLVGCLPGVGTVMLAVFGVFQLAAALVTLIPSLGHDRVPMQFVPVWTYFLDPLYDEKPNEAMVKVIAVGSQYVIGLSEAVIGWLLVAAAASGTRRVGLARIGLSFAAGLFGTFMLTMFIMHEKTLPAWNQYPAILGWIAVTWVVVRVEEGWGGGKGGSER
ncbi:MAG: hypothetical protein KF757_13470 [Phycisphaeraceae bacterium]|nr:hypothetical protein [Phycisphaeraceae bacterium]MCW5763972.1 hypothetical protein [Phycisphaeraceae bacterium]